MKQWTVQDVTTIDVSEADLLHKVEFIGEDADFRLLEWATKNASRAKANATIAGILMTSPAVTVQPGASLVVAAKRMEDEHIERLPVLDEMGRLIEIVSTSSPRRRSPRR